MTAYSWLWIGWIVAFLAIEIPAAISNESTKQPKTLSMHIWALIKGNGPVHYTFRLALVLFLAWLSIHLLGGGNIL